MHFAGGSTVSSTTALWFTLSGALGAAVLAAVATLVAVVLANRHDRKVRVDDKRLVALNDLVAAADGFRTSARLLVAAYAQQQAKGGRTIDPEIDAYLERSMTFGNAAQAAGLFVMNTRLEAPMRDIEKAHIEVSLWTATSTNGAVIFSGNATTATTSHDEALAAFDRALSAFAAACQKALGIT